MLNNSERLFNMELNQFVFPAGLILTGKFTDSFGKDQKNLYCYFVFEGGKVLVKAPSQFTPGQRVRVLFEASFDFSVLSNGRSLESFRPARFLALEPCK